MNSRRFTFISFLFITGCLLACGMPASAQAPASSRLSSPGGLQGNDEGPPLRLKIEANPRQGNVYIYDQDNRLVRVSRTGRREILKSQVYMVRVIGDDNFFFCWKGEALIGTKGSSCEYTAAPRQNLEIKWSNIFPLLLVLGTALAYYRTRNRIITGVTTFTSSLRRGRTAPPAAAVADDTGASGNDKNHSRTMASEEES